MDAIKPSGNFHPPVQRGYPMPAPEIPKQRIPFFTWLLIGFAAVVLAGIIFSFADVADEPRPTLTDPALGTPAPATPPPATPAP